MSVSGMPPATPERFQAEIDALSAGEELELNAFEYPGPVSVRRAVTIDGHGATIWASNGPVLIVETAGVTLRNLKIEVTQEGAVSGGCAGRCALEVKNDHNPLLENVEVRGCVRGLAAEEGEWRYPTSLSLSEIVHNTEHSYRMHLYVPVPCKLTSHVYGIDVDRHTLAPGKNEITLTVDVLPRDSLILGNLSITTAFLRRQIAISGHVVSADPNRPVQCPQDGSLIYSPHDWDTLGKVRRQESRTVPVTGPSQPEPAPQPPPVYPERGPKDSLPSTAPQEPTGTSAAPMRRTQGGRSRNLGSLSGVFDSKQGSEEECNKQEAPAPEPKLQGAWESEGGDGETGGLMAPPPEPAEPPMSAGQTHMNNIGLGRAFVTTDGTDAPQEGSAKQDGLQKSPPEKSPMPVPPAGRSREASDVERRRRKSSGTSVPITWLSDTSGETNVSGAASGESGIEDPCRGQRQADDPKKDPGSAKFNGTPGAFQE